MKYNEGRRQYSPKYRGHLLQRKYIKTNDE